MCGGMQGHGGHADTPMGVDGPASQPMMGLGSPCMSSSAPAP